MPNDTLETPSERLVVLDMLDPGLSNAEILLRSQGMAIRELNTLYVECGHTRYILLQRMQLIEDEVRKRAEAMERAQRLIP